ncbi:MAG: M23 family metallopeptidase [Cyclobacteriaceae bacterium]|nr:M23 family metallopeptidase [Cyclobacteriaceae bacterium HetDA_MAG_MS6]
MRISIHLLALFFLSHAIQAQVAENYYQFPINPGQQNYLSGTMGELRSTHFHAGIDIKTGGKIGLPVYAVADGYISRINVATGGYGHALYLNHDNQTTSVYAHLDQFSDQLQAYVIDQQYKDQSYEIRIFPEKDQFFFKKGEVIGYSGNTGSSRGPHLHFEIRDSQQRVVDPLSYGFEEIKDNIRPILKKVAFVTLDEEARVNGAFGRFEYDVLRASGKYVLRKPIQLQGKIGLEIYHYDLLNGAYSKNGVSEIIMTLDGDTVFHQRKDTLSFSQMRDILVHMDYSRYKNGGRKFNRLFLTDGNHLDFYKVTNPGILFGSEVHLMNLYLKDRYGNSSELSASINSKPVEFSERPSFETFQVQDNFLHIRSATNDPVMIHSAYQNTPLPPYRYTEPHGGFYLWDLRKGLPDSIHTGDKKIDPEFYVTVPSQTDFEFYNHHVNLAFDRRSLFDTLYLRFSKTIDPSVNRELFKFYHADFPVRRNITITLKPEQSYGEKAGVYAIQGRKLSFHQSRLTEEGFSFRTRDLVTYTIAEDTVPPKITPVSISRSKIAMEIEDEMSGIHSYQATLNGEWLLMRFETKDDLIFSVPKKQNTPLKGEFILEVKDYADNISTFKRTIR